MPLPSSFKILGTLLLVLVACPAWAADCAAYLRSADFLQQAELHFIRQIKPLAATYPFINDMGHEILAVLYWKFPLDRQHDLPELKLPSSKLQRLWAVLHQHPDYYYFSKRNFRQIRHLESFTVSREFKDIGKVRNAKVVLFPFLRTPPLGDPHDQDQVDIITDIHQRYLRWVIEVMHQLGYHSLAQSAVEQAIKHLAQNDFNGLWIPAITEHLSQEMQQGLHQAWINKIQQIMEVDRGQAMQTLRRPFMPQKKIVW